MTRQALYWVLERDVLVGVGTRPTGEDPEAAMQRVLHDHNPTLSGVYTSPGVETRVRPRSPRDYVRRRHGVLYALGRWSNIPTGVRVERSWRVSGTLHLQRVPAADGAVDEPDRILVTLTGRKARPFGDLAYVQEPTWLGTTADASDWDPGDRGRWLAWAGFETLSPVHTDPDGDLFLHVLTGNARR
ncbi:hypothetical protein LG293_17905 (plasmid) [Citricoccus nitrophenolicus]